MTIMQWMMRWAAMLLSRYRIGDYNKTPYERQKGKVCDMEVLPFGEAMWFRTLTDSVGRKRARELKWQEVVWLGQSRNTSEAFHVLISVVCAVGLLDRFPPYSPSFTCIRCVLCILSFGCETSSRYRPTV